MLDDNTKTLVAGIADSAAAYVDDLYRELDARIGALEQTYGIEPPPTTTSDADRRRRDFADGLRQHLIAALENA